MWLHFPCFVSASTPILCPKNPTHSPLFSRPLCPSAPVACSLLAFIHPNGLFCGAVNVYQDLRRTLVGPLWDPHTNTLSPPAACLSPLPLKHVCILPTLNHVCQVAVIELSHIPIMTLAAPYCRLLPLKHVCQGVVKARHIPVMITHGSTQHVHLTLWYECKHCIVTYDSMLCLTFSMHLGGGGEGGGGGDDDEVCVGVTRWAAQEYTKGTGSNTQECRARTVHVHTQTKNKNTTHLQEQPLTQPTTQHNTHNNTHTTPHTHLQEQPLTQPTSLWLQHFGIKHSEAVQHPCLFIVSQVLYCQVVAQCITCLWWWGVCVGVGGWGCRG